MHCFIFSLRVCGVSATVGLPWLWFRRCLWPRLSTRIQVSTCSSAGLYHPTPRRAPAPAPVGPAAPGSPWVPSAASYRAERIRRGTAGPPASSPPSLVAPRRPPAASGSRTTPCAAAAPWSSCWLSATKRFPRPRFFPRRCPPRSSPGPVTLLGRAAERPLEWRLMETLWATRWWSENGKTTL